MDIIENDKIPRKWEWLAAQFEKCGFSQTASDAKKIDQEIACIYGNKHTIRWILDYSSFRNTNDFNTYIVIATQEEYCTACALARKLEAKTHIYYCDVCEFGKKVGKCREEGSLYNVFGKIYREEKKYIEVKGGELKCQT